MDLGVMAMKGYSTLPKTPGLEPQHQIFLVSYLGHQLPYTSAEMESMYTLVLADGMCVKLEKYLSLDREVKIQTQR